MVDEPIAPPPPPPFQNGSNLRHQRRADTGIVRVKYLRLPVLPVEPSNKLGVGVRGEHPLMPLETRYYLLRAHLLRARPHALLQAAAQDRGTRHHRRFHLFPLTAHFFREKCHRWFQILEPIRKVWGAGGGGEGCCHDFACHCDGRHTDLAHDPAIYPDIPGFPPVPGCIFTKGCGISSYTACRSCLC